MHPRSESHLCHAFWSAQRPASIVCCFDRLTVQQAICSEDVGVINHKTGDLVVAPAPPNTISSCIALFKTIFDTHREPYDVRASRVLMFADDQHANLTLTSVIHSHRCDDCESRLVTS